MIARGQAIDMITTAERGDPCGPPGLRTTSVRKGRPLGSFKDSLFTMLRTLQIG
jgi:hypothetical protein